MALDAGADVLELRRQAIREHVARFEHVVVHGDDLRQFIHAGSVSKI
jgi:hypothetical protein